MNLNDFNHELLPEWNENHPENFLQQLVFIKEQGLLTDPDIIFAFLAKNQKFNVYDSMTLSERTNIMEFCEFIRKQYAAANQTPYLFERLFQEENEHPANFLARVKTHYYLSRDCVRIPDDSNMAEVDKVTIRDHYIMGLHSYEVRESVRLNCTQYGNLVALTQQFSQSIEELKATADFSSNLETTEKKFIYTKTIFIRTIVLLSRAIISFIKPTVPLTETIVSITDVSITETILSPIKTMVILAKSIFLLIETAKEINNQTFLAFTEVTCALCIRYKQSGCKPKLKANYEKKIDSKQAFSPTTVNSLQLQDL